MSCVVGVIHDGKVYIGADGLATTNEGEKRPIITNKVFRNGKYLFGFTGSVRTGQVLYSRYFTPPRDIYDMPDSIREHMAQKGTLLTNEEQAQAHAANFLIGFNGRLFEILIDFQMNEVSGNYTALGSGGPYALGSLFTTRKSYKMKPENRIIRALEAASQFDASCGPPFMTEVIE